MLFSLSNLQKSVTRKKEEVWCLVPSWEFSNFNALAANYF